MHTRLSPDPEALIMLCTPVSGSRPNLDYFLGVITCSCIPKISSNLAVVEQVVAYSFHLAFATIRLLQCVTVAGIISSSTFVTLLKGMGSRWAPDIHGYH